MKLAGLFAASLLFIGFSCASSSVRSEDDAYIDLGISLSSGYGTISARVRPRSSYPDAAIVKLTDSEHLSTGDPTEFFIDIAKIHGSKAYKNFMLGKQKGTLNIDAPKLCPLLDGLCQYWPIRTAQSVNPLAPMLQALVAAAESALESSVSSVAITSYDLDVPNGEVTKRYALSALEGIGVASPDFLDHSASAAITALGFRSPACGYDFTPPFNDQQPEQLILSVEFTSDSLSASLWTEECQVVERWAWAHSTAASHDKMVLIGSSTNQTWGFENEFRSALNKVCAAFLSDLGGPESAQKAMTANSNGETATLETLGTVLLMGEHAGDAKMQGLLREVLQQHFANGDSVDFLTTQAIAMDMTFVGSRAAAANVGWSPDA